MSAEPRLVELRGQILRRDVVLDDEQHDVVRVLDEEVRQRREPRLERLGAEFAEAVAEVQPPLAKVLAREAASDAQRGLDAFRADGLLDLRP